MNDRELLELAAKAAGFGNVWYLEEGGAPYIGEKYKLGKFPMYRVFRPLSSNNEAFRLMVACGLRVECGIDGHVYVLRGGDLLWNEIALHEHEIEERLAATRRAIVRAAAEIGRGMK